MAKKAADDDTTQQAYIDAAFLVDHYGKGVLAAEAVDMHPTTISALKNANAAVSLRLARRLREAVLKIEAEKAKGVVSGSKLPENNGAGSTLQHLKAAAKYMEKAEEEIRFAANTAASFAKAGMLSFADDLARKRKNYIEDVL